jgi:hypothetical protein
LNTQQITVKFVHRLFTNEQQQQCVCVCVCVSVCQELLDEVRYDQNFLLRAITSDKTCVCCYGPKAKQQSSGWKSLSYSCLKKVRQQVKHQEHVGDLFKLWGHFIRNLFLQAERLPSIATTRFGNVWWSKSTENIQNDGGTSTGSFTVTMCQHILLCQCSNFGS